MPTLCGRISLDDVKFQELLNDASLMVVESKVFNISWREMSKD